MEELLKIEADAKYLLGAKDRSYERTLMQELLKIVEEAEFLFGPRDRSYELLEPRITERAYAQGYLVPSRKIRIYLTNHSENERYIGAYELAHEAVHLLSPVSWGEATMLEEGLATYFSHRYIDRVYGLRYERASHPKYDAAMRSVSTLLAKNEFVIKELRVRQPVISKIDVGLLVEVAGIDLNHAEFLCTDFETYGRTTTHWSDFAAQGAERLDYFLHSIWD